MKEKTVKAPEIRFCFLDKERPCEASCKSYVPNAGDCIVIQSIIGIDFTLRSETRLMAASKFDIADTTQMIKDVLCENQQIDIELHHDIQNAVTEELTGIRKALEHPEAEKSEA